MIFCCKDHACTEPCGLKSAGVSQSIARVPHQTTDYNAARQQDYHSQRLLVTLHEHPSEHARAEGNVLPGVLELKEVRPCTSAPPRARLIGRAQLRVRASSTSSLQVVCCLPSGVQRNACLISWTVPSVTTSSSARVQF